MVRKVIEVQDCLDAQSESKNNRNANNRAHKNISEKKQYSFRSRSSKDKNVIEVTSSFSYN